MRLTVKEKQKATRITAARYQKVSKKKKGAILDEFIALTGYNRCYASYLLKNHGRKLQINKKVIVIGDIRRRHKKGNVRYLRLYANFFQPVMKLIQKTRIGSKVKKKYDKPQTPYQRVLVSPFVPENKKEILRQQYAQLNPADLRRQIAKLQDKLLKIADRTNIR